MKKSEYKYKKVVVDIWPKIFDQIFVVSLPDSHDRRQYMDEHLKEVGLVPFDYHDATGSSSAPASLMIASALATCSVAAPSTTMTNRSILAEDR